MINKIISMIDSWGEMNKKQGIVEGSLRVYENRVKDPKDKAELKKIRDELVESQGSINNVRELIIEGLRIMDGTINKV